MSENGALQDAADFVAGRVKNFGGPIDVVSAVAVAMANERLASAKNAVVIEIIDGKPVVSITVKDDDKRDELEALARRIIHSGAL